MVQTAPGHPKVDPWLCPTPCVRPFVVLPEGPIRALFAQDGRLFAVAGASFYEVFPSQTYALRGTAVSDGKPATISSNGKNGNQLFVISGGKGYIYNLITDVITAVADADFQSDIEPVSMGSQSDGYFIALKAQSNSFFISALLDGNDWDLLDVYQVSQSSGDELVALFVLHREIYVCSRQTISVWQNTGDADTPFQPAPGVQIAQGLGAAFGWALIDNTVLFLGGNEIGDRVVYRMDGYSPKVVSTDAVHFALNNYPRVDDAIAWAYQDEGHPFYVLYLPTPPVVDRHGVDHTCWVYDIATGAWHERALWDPTFVQWIPYIGRCHAHAFGKHLIGDRAGSAIYDYSLEYHTDILVRMGA